MKQSLRTIMLNQKKAGWNNTYYVDGSVGSDANDGKAPGAGHAFQTLAAAMALTLTADQTVALKCGQTFVSQNWKFNQSGTSGHPITLTSYSTGANPILRGAITVTGMTLDSGSIYKKTGFSNGTWTSCSAFQDAARLIKKTSKVAMVAGSFFYDSAGTTLYVWTVDGSDPAGHTIEWTVWGNASPIYGVDINGQSDITITGIDVVVSVASCFGMRTPAASTMNRVTFNFCNGSWSNQRAFDLGAGTTKHNITFNNCTGTYCNGEGFWFGFGDYMQANNCSSHHNGQDNNAKGPTVTNAGTGFTTSDSINYSGFYKCLSYMNTSGTSQISIESEGGYNSPQYITVDSCVCISLQANSDLGWANEEGWYSVWKNNTFYGDRQLPMIQLRQPYNTCVSPTFVNNTFDFYPSNNQTMFSVTALTGLHIYNNILNGNANVYFAQVPVAGQTGFASDYNVWSGSTSWKWGASWVAYAAWCTAVGETHSIQTAQTFRNYATHDYHLAVGDTARNAGHDYSLGVTVDMDGVTRPATPDIGAYQYV